jgi:solute carrier family 35 (adenosine 3'-phospho 5'-phosphosulfate transporter), member B2
LLLLSIINTTTAITKSIRTYESPRRVRISGTLTRFLVFFMTDKAEVVDVESSPQKEDYTEQPISGVWTYAAVAEFSCCFFGLQISYLIWGIMQELIMDTKFNPTPLNPSGMFPSATFCVFSNRFLAIIVAAVICRIKYGTLKTSAPLIYFTPCAVSNTISSWGQYQALSFVSFSLQTLFKATKVIPVMIMGRIIKGSTYCTAEYVEAVLITGGVAFFSLASKTSQKNTEEGFELAGFLLLSIYVLADSFTSQWQSRIYRDYGKIDHFHMMYGVNVSSIIVTSVALVASGEIPRIWEFLLYNPTAVWYNVLTAITSTTGQIAIFYTIKNFGPIVFTIIMTTRQMISIVLSTILFGHQMNLGGAMGASVVFIAIFHSVYRQTNEKRAVGLQAQRGQSADRERLLDSK